MRIRRSKTTVLAIGLFGLVSASDRLVRGDYPFVETVEILPTWTIYETTSLVAPTSAFIPTAFSATVYDLRPTTTFVPTTTILPTTFVPTSTVFSTRSYIPTSTIVPTSTTYYPTRSIYRIGRRRLFERSATYVIPTYYSSSVVTPTSYLTPTSFVSGGGLLAASALCCESAASPTIQLAPMPMETPPAVVRRSAANSGMESSVAGEPEKAGAVDRDDRVRPASPSAGPRKSSAPTSSVVNPLAEETTSKTTRPAPAETTTTPPASPAAPETGPAPIDLKTPVPPPEGATPPAVPLPDPPTSSSPLDFPKSDGEVRRDSFKVAAPTSITKPSPAGRNVLTGLLVSADTKVPEEGVEVILTDRSGRFLDRRARTDAFGKFAVSLPEGDWTIKITMPSGRVLSVGEGVVTAVAGRVNDKYGRELTNLIISR